MMLSGVVHSMTRRSAGSALLAASILAAILLAGCKEDETNQNPVTPINGPDTPAEFTDRGWERFEVANFSGALSDFNAAIFLNPSFGEANIGQGWARLMQATSPNSMRGAASTFVSAILNGENGADVLAGRAAAYLGSGNSFLDAAVVDAQAALAADADFVFMHRPSFNAEDLHLIEAFAQAGQGNFTGALSAADLVLDSNIDEGNAETWVVDGTTYDSFNGAALAHLHMLSGQYSG
jgi:tetratricopeptide (TPR) repeat protein